MACSCNRTSRADPPGPRHVWGTQADDLACCDVTSVAFMFGPGTRRILAAMIAKDARRGCR